MLFIFFFCLLCVTIGECQCDTRNKAFKVALASCSKYQSYTQLKSVKQKQLNNCRHRFGHSLSSMLSFQIRTFVHIRIPMLLLPLSLSRHHQHYSVRYVVRAAFACWTIFFFLLRFFLRFFLRFVFTYTSNALDFIFFFLHGICFWPTFKELINFIRNIVFVDVPVRAAVAVTTSTTTTRAIVCVCASVCNWGS